MKIFNDFDTKWKQKAYNRIVKTYWEENIIFIELVIILLPLNMSMRKDIKVLSLMHIGFLSLHTTVL